MSPERLVHHELCFGCGRTNLFGLLMEVEAVGDRHVRGRAFVKQDHQGAEPRTAHEGVVLAALSEAMSLACGPDARPRKVELEVHGPAPVGSFIDVEAEAGAGAGAGAGGDFQASASAVVEGTPVATARGIYLPA